MKSLKILIADDDRHVRKALRLRLSAWGYEVVESIDGLGVIERVTPENIDALVLDHEMPNGDGRTVAHLIRRETDAPIIFLSGHDRSEFLSTALRLPDVYYLNKPLEAERLKNLLDSYFAPKSRRIVPV